MCRIVMVLMVSVLGVGAAPSVEDLKGVPVSALPGKAAELVKAAGEEDRAQLVVAVMKSVNETQPKALVPVLEAVAKAAPKVADKAAGKAASLQTSNILAIARVATTGAPGYAPLIVKAVTPKAPELWSEITIEIAIASPDQAHGIVLALNGTIRNVRDYVERAKTTVQSGRSNRSSVALLMYETEEIIEAERGEEAGKSIGEEYRRDYGEDEEEEEEAVEEKGDGEQ